MENTQLSPRLRLPEVLQILQCSRSFLYDSIRKGNLPAPVKLGIKYSFWWRDQIEMAARLQDWKQATSYLEQHGGAA